MYVYPFSGGGKANPHVVQQSNSVSRLHHGIGPQSHNTSYSGQALASQYEQHDRYRGASRDTVPKLVVEEKEQEILAKEETISVGLINDRRCHRLPQ